MTSVKKRIPTPKLKLKKLAVKDIPSLKSPSYRQVMDIVLEHIETYNLQDPNHCSNILIDQPLKLALNIESESLSVQALSQLIFEKYLG